jgi:hypothetical protein
MLMELPWSELRCLASIEYLRILEVLANTRTLHIYHELTIATLRPNWFLISPFLIDAGACSSMSWYRCLIPMMAAVKLKRLVVLG